MTGRRFRFPAGRPLRADGFAMVELLLSLCILSLFTLLSLHAAGFSMEAYYIFPERYTRIKSESLLTGESRSYEDETDMAYPPISFGENGTVNQARTLTFANDSVTRQIIIELSTGALVFR